jgi:hypothetical protein
VQTLIPDDEPEPQWRALPEGTPGRCGNLDYCSIGMHRVLVSVPIGQAFTCPECGGKLRPPKSVGRGAPWLLPALGMVLLLAGLALGTIQGYLYGRLHPAIRRGAQDASASAALQVTTARALLGLSKLPEGEVSLTVPEPQPPVALISPSSAPTPPEVHARPFPLHPPPLESADPSPHLQQEERFGQVTLDCVLLATQGKPSCHISNLRGADAFSAVSLRWLQNLAIRYAPEARTGDPHRLDHRWRVIFEDFSGAAAPPGSH